MSYNIETWKTKRLIDFFVPLAELNKLEDIQISQLTDEMELEAIGPTESFTIKGTLVGKGLHVRSINYGGEGSGYLWDNFKELLKHSRGVMEAVQVWEGGDSITRLTVVNGDIKQETVEL